jgi:microcystin-dependent protein
VGAFRFLHRWTALVKPDDELADVVHLLEDRDRELEDHLTDVAVPVGLISAYGASTAPAGWVLCNGAAISRSTYAALFAIVGTTFGVGDGSTTFNVPDLRDRVPKGANTVALGATGNPSTSTETVSGTTGGDSPNHDHNTFDGATPSVTGGVNVQHAHSFSDDHSHSVSGATALGVTFIIKA